MIDDEAASRISEIVAEILTRGRAADLDEEMVGCGLLGGVLDIAKKSETPAAWAELFHRYGILIGAREGAS